MATYSTTKTINVTTEEALADMPKWVKADPALSWVYLNDLSARCDMRSATTKHMRNYLRRQAQRRYYGEI